MSGEGFGLLYASTFTGSLFGSPATVFAVWGYVVANGYGGRVDLNPRMLAAMFATTAGDIEAAVRLLCAPDPDSRTDTAEGRRLRHLGGVAYEIINHDVYKNARALEEKRASDRARKRASRESARGTVDVPVLSAPLCDLSQKSVTSADSLLSSLSDLISSDPEGVQGEGDHGPPPDPDHPTAEAGTGAAAPSPNDATKAEVESRPLGAPPAAAAPTHLREPSNRAPVDFAPTPEQRARCAELGLDVDKLVRKFKRQEFKRAYRDWASRFDTWIDEEPPPKRASSPPAGRARGRPPWVRDEHERLAAERGRELSDAMRDFARGYGPGVRGTDPSCVASAFTLYLSTAPPRAEPRHLALVQ